MAWDSRQHLASGVIQLSMAESDGELRRLAGIRKHNDSDRAKELREFHIDGDGFRVDRGRRSHRVRALGRRQSRPA